MGMGTGIHFEIINAITVPFQHRIIHLTGMQERKMGARLQVPSYLYSQPSIEVIWMHIDSNRN